MREYFPDGQTLIDDWFYDYSTPKNKALGREFLITDFGAVADGRMCTANIQAAIDSAAESGGGVVCVPRGTFKSGALFFKKGVHLYIAEGGVLVGSDDVSDYPLLQTRIEGETCKYFAALINADRADNFTMFGEGTIDGNGERSWKAFWLRLEWNPAATNKDEQRPRLVYISNSKNVTVCGLTLKNSHFWTTDIYKCSRVRFLNLKIFSPEKPIPSPSTDAIDIDACCDVLVKNCFIHVNDDGIALKGGKGEWADEDKSNGGNQRIIIEDCTYGYAHACLTCGSEAIHNKNIIMRRINVEYAINVLWLKMRPDTPQKYEYIEVDEVRGRADTLLNINPWTQFYRRGERELPRSLAENISMKNCDITCKTDFSVCGSDKYIIRNFTLEKLSIRADNNVDVSKVITNITYKN